MKKLAQLTLLKAERSADQKTAKIKGVISTEATDLQGESVAQDGLDFSYFLKRGWLNYDHQTGPANILGYPSKVTRQGAETILEGTLLLEQPKAREIYKTARRLERAQTGRGLGFSIEGQVIDRDPQNPNRITRARVLHVAITPSPVNPYTSLELLKSLIGYQTPSAPAEGLSALVPQDLNGTLANASSDALNGASLEGLFDKRLASIIRALGLHFPAAPVDTILNTARELAGGSPKK